jgi:hypothetical protein
MHDDDEDALVRWRRLKEQSTEPPKPQPQQTKERAMPDVQLRADFERHRREALAYRAALEKAISTVIARTQAEHDKLRAEIAELRTRLESRTADTSSVVRLPAPRMVGHAISA